MGSHIVDVSLAAAGFEPLTHRPSSLDPDHTACGLTLERFPINRNLQLGAGETCAQCTHVVAQLAAARARSAALEAPTEKSPTR